VKSLAVLANHAFELGAKEVQLQTWGGSVKELVATGSELANIDSSIVVRISTSLN
jgi:transaldolase